MNTPLVTVYPASPKFYQTASFGVSGVGATACVILAATSPSTFWPTYLVATTFLMGISLGCLGISLLHQMTGGQWGLEIARNLAAGTAMLPFASLFYIPLAIGAGHLYPWLAPSHEKHLLNEHQVVYFATWFWAIRVVFFLAVWSSLSVMVVRRYASLAQTGLAETWTSTPRLSALALIGLGVTTTFAMIDWIMSLEPRWMSTIYPAILMLGFVVSAFAFVLLMQLLPGSSAGFPDNVEVTNARALDLGNLLMAFLLLWVYLAVSQFLIIWSADLPIESSWYHRRLTGVWPGIGLILVLCHFIIPFGILLSRDFKKSPLAMAFVAGMLLVTRVLDLALTIVPTRGIDATWWPLHLLVALAATGGLWFGVFLNRRAMLPQVHLNLAISVPHTIPEGGPA